MRLGEKGVDQRFLRLVLAPDLPDEFERVRLMNLKRFEIIRQFSITIATNW